MTKKKQQGQLYAALYASLGSKGRKRELRADELTSVCAVLKINPMDFAEEKEGA